MGPMIRPRRIMRDGPQEHGVKARQASPATSSPTSSEGAFAAPKRGPAYPKAVDRLIAEFAKLPGIGRRTAERLAFYILKSDEPTALGLAQAVVDVKKTVRHCEACFNLADTALCDICSDQSRDRRVV